MSTVVDPGSVRQSPRARGIPIHPVLFALFPLLTLYAHNIGEIAVSEIVRPIAYALIASLGIWGIVAVCTHHVRKSAIIASILAVAFFSYGHVVNLTPPPVKTFIAPVGLFALTVVVILLIKSRRAFIPSTSILNIASVGLVIQPCVLIGPNIWKTLSPIELNRQLLEEAAKLGGLNIQEPRRIASISPSDAARLPDIYYIILDAYGREDSLKTFFQWDNSRFLSALEQRGFFVAQKSRANYDHTPLCLASSLNMAYLDPLTPHFGTTSHLDAARKLLDNNAVAANLSKHGYHYVYVWSGADLTKVLTADLVLQSKSQISNFENQAIGITALNSNPEIERKGYDRHRDFINVAFNELSNVARLPYPKFVFTHIISPHPPFVFGPNGEPVNPKGPETIADGSTLLKDITREEYQRGYVAQLQYINRRVIDSVDTILKHSRSRPIIIIQGDHGSRMTLDWESRNKTDVREAFSILNAYYVPDNLRSHLYDSITPVNSFRVILSELFGEEYPRLPDRSFYSTEAHPYLFSDVTSDLNQLLPNG